MKKIIQILTICIILIGIVIIPAKGFNVGLKYSEHIQIDINIGKEFNSDDIKEIAKEVFGTDNVIVQKVELYQDMVQIIVKDATDEQLTNLNAKINEKYEISNEMADIQTQRNANTRLRTLLKPYVIPMFITFAAILVYIVIRFYKLDTWKILYKSAMALVVPQLVLFSLIAITRIPISSVTPIISIVVFIVCAIATIMVLQGKLEKENDKKEIEE